MLSTANLLMVDHAADGISYRKLERNTAMLTATSVLGLAAHIWQPENYARQHICPVSSGGRQAAWFVEGDWGHAVLRYYRRGGLIARLSRSTYFWQGEMRTRSFAEFRLMHALFYRGLNVPQPLAAVYWRRGGTYQAAIMTRRIPNAVSLADTLVHHANTAWPDPVAIAQSVAQLHAAGVWHADLNAHNILLNAKGEVWIIDFDRARASATRCNMLARYHNLQRLKRSLIKLNGQSVISYWAKINSHYQKIVKS